MGHKNGTGKTRGAGGGVARNWGPPGETPPSHARERRACHGVGRPPHTLVMASSPMRKLRKTGAVDQDGNVVTIPRLPSVAGSNKPPGWNRWSAAEKAEHLLGLSLNRMHEYLSWSADQLDPYRLCSADAGHPRSQGGRSQGWGRRAASPRGRTMAFFSSIFSLHRRGVLSCVGSCSSGASAGAAEPPDVIRLSCDLRDRNIRRAASPASGVKSPERSSQLAHAGRAGRPRRGVQAGARRRLRVVVRDGGYNPLVPSRRARLKSPPKPALGLNKGQPRSP